ncbi:hypothetical protein SRB17_72640 [Streptomyces sp. RB17]|uniref:hypothetical protein n=1 Tax=Streptomyces sp. RB17 TaxID=2585197 RepID=UPI001294A429|nr:hypothetical protein [Streptomyces sp. RB17]MQY39242.1 hypothetical protein [Streptomyces sp. RB17]
MAPELPDGAFVLARILFVSLACYGIYTAVQGFGVSDRTSWDDSELTNPVRQATDDLNGYRFTVDDSGTPLYFYDYASLLKDKVVEYAGGDAPQTGVTVTPSDADTADDAHLTVTADGADASFCTHLERSRFKKDDYSPARAQRWGEFTDVPGRRDRSDDTEGRVLTRGSGGRAG